MGYVVSNGGAFGVERRRYLTEDGIEMVVIEWGRSGWITPVPACEVHSLRSPYESEARREAELVLKEIER